MANFQWKKRYFIVIFFIVIILGGIYFYLQGFRKVVLIEEESYFHDFYVENNKVYIQCEIVLQNNSNKDEKVKLLADMKEDARLGLLTSSAVYGYSKKGNNEFVVPAKSKKEYNVYFIGDFAGNKIKQNRNLPSIEVIPSEGESEARSNRLSFNIKGGGMAYREGSHWKKSGRSRLFLRLYHVF